jgi:hypothetical protein
MIKLLTIVASALLVGGLLLAPEPAAADGAWLDGGTAPTWNSPGMAIPKAPPREPLLNPMCFDALVVPDTQAKQALVAAGWFLFGTAIDVPGVEIVSGQSNADGMCRPTQYQTFVFVDGVFAGTLSPVLMDSRVDGALTQALVDPSGQIEAQYVRYRNEDPLCCPYARTTAVFEIAREAGGPVVRLLRASTVPNSAPTAVPPPPATRPSATPVPAPVQAPAQVPRSSQ